MRWLLFLIVVFAVLWYIRGVEEVEPPPIEEGIIGSQVKALRKAEGFEKEYLDATKERNQRMDEQVEKESGG